jgi:hypothetical protein
MHSPGLLESIFRVTPKNKFQVACSAFFELLSPHFSSYREVFCNAIPSVLSRTKKLLAVAASIQGSTIALKKG